MLGFNQAPTEGDPPIVALASEWWLARIRAYIWPGFLGAGLILKRGLIESPCHESREATSYHISRWSWGRSWRNWGEKFLKMSPYIHNPHPVHDQNANLQNIILLAAPRGATKHRFRGGRFCDSGCGHCNLGQKRDSPGNNATLHNQIRSNK